MLKMIKFSHRLDSVSEYYFSSKLREVKSLVDSGKDIINLGIGSPDLSPVSYTHLTLPTICSV